MALDPHGLSYPVAAVGARTSFCVSHLRVSREGLVALRLLWVWPSSSCDSCKGPFKEAGIGAVAACRQPLLIHGRDVYCAGSLRCQE